MEAAMRNRAVETVEECLRRAMQHAAMLEAAFLAMCAEGCG
jgi:hypothetical protein